MASQPEATDDPINREESETVMDFFGIVLILATVALVELGRHIYSIVTKIAVERTGKKKIYTTAGGATAICICEFERIDEMGLALHFTDRDETYIAFQAIKPDQSVESSSSYSGSDKNIGILDTEIEKYRGRATRAKIYGRSANKKRR